jgi:hypothetical protein
MFGYMPGSRECIEHLRRPDHVYGTVKCSLPQRLGCAGLCGKVHDGIRLLQAKQRVPALGMCHVERDETDVRMQPCRAYSPNMDLRVQDIDDRHLSTSLQQPA